MVHSKCEEHDYEILDAIQIVGWDENDVAIPCRLETWQCVNCGDYAESVEEMVDNEYETDMMFQ